MVGSRSHAARRVALLVLTVLAFVPLSDIRAAGTGRPLSAEAFEARLVRARALAAAATPHPTAAEMAAVRKALGLPVDVRFPGGTVTVGPDPFLEGLGGSSAGDFHAASAHLAALETGVRAALRTSPVDEAMFRQALARSLNGVSTGPSLGQRFQRAIAHLMRWLVSRLAHVHGAGSLVAWLIVVGLLAGLLLLARTFGLGVVPEERGRRPSETAPPLGPTEWRRLAEDALAVGDRVGAVRCLYHAIAALLDARGIVAAAPTLTAGEFLTATRVALPLLSEPVEEATRVFERSVYGLRVPADEEVAAVARAERTVRNS